MANSLHEELLHESGKGGACKICSYLHTLDAATRAEWAKEIALPHEVVSHMALVVVLKRHGVSIEEASVRRHRNNHVAA